MTDPCAVHAHSRSADPYVGRPPWDIGAPQPAMLTLAQNGAFRGRVLDVGCGTGEHTLMAAASGLDATGIDLAAGALQAAERKAHHRGVRARFVHYDALRVAEFGETFDTVLDSLFLHAFTAADRAVYVNGLRTVLRPGGRLFVLCYSDRHTSEPDVPHKLSQNNLESGFTDGWALESVKPTVCSSNVHADGIAAWLATCTRI
ncbi:class I SAM-dependent methyltransferase [Actinoallomurus sp. CA-150999]|uniref:class I SAM-dependent methyltransferase n=1 Tax=Actinoallomurus sp. CA-150999 TaxID=3239887 RepID=UPI003D8CFF82